MGNLLFWLGIGVAQKGAGRSQSAINEAALGHGSDVAIGLTSLA